MRGFEYPHPDGVLLWSLIRLGAPFILRAEKHTGTVWQKKSIRSSERVVSCGATLLFHLVFDFPNTCFCAVGILKR